MEISEEKKDMTLRQFIKLSGGQEAAAVRLGVRSSTIWRWLTKVSNPQGNNARRLKDFGVKVA